MADYGRPGFILTYNNTTLINNTQPKARLILDDYEPDYEEQIMLSGTREIKSGGVYLNPKIIIKAADYDKTILLQSMVGKKVRLQPRWDNYNWQFDCWVVSVLPLFEKGVYWKDSLEIQLKSVGFVNATPRNPYIQGGKD